jgi:hypothetical protein
MSHERSNGRFRDNLCEASDVTQEGTQECIRKNPRGSIGNLPGGGALCARQR